MGAKGDYSSGVMVMVGSGYEINWNSTPGNTTLFNHPLYIKYASSTFDSINLNECKQDLGKVMATVGSQEICAYLSWLIRSVTLVVSP